MGEEERFSHLKVVWRLVHLGACVSAVKYAEHARVQFSLVALKDMRRGKDHYARTYAVIVLEGLITPGDVVLERSLDECLWWSEMQAIGL